VQPRPTPISIEPPGADVEGGGGGAGGGGCGGGVGAGVGAGMAGGGTPVALGSPQPSYWTQIATVTTLLGKWRFAQPGLLAG
jgi:hypothetical protein